MKVIIPLAGKGTRLRPHTHVTPKPMMKVAGKPVMSYVLDELKKLGNVEQIIYITGHLKEKVEEFARAEIDVPSVFIEQKVQDGTAGAIALASDYVDQPVLIIFVDTIFDADLSMVKSVDADGIIWVKEVEDYQRFGVVVTDKDGNMTKIVEKPKTPISKRANIGLYYIRNWKLLFEGIDHVLKQPKNQGEYFLTDAFQYMIDKGAKIRVIDVEGWYDAGKIETMLETNQAMLERGRARQADRCGRLDDHRSRLHRGQRHAEEIEDRAQRLDRRRLRARGRRGQRLDRRVEGEDHEVGAEELARRRRDCRRGREG